jgi:hypothetical protein
MNSVKNVAFPASKLVLYTTTGIVVGILFFQYLRIPIRSPTFNIPMPPPARCPSIFDHRRRKMRGSSFTVCGRMCAGVKGEIGIGEQREYI